MDDLRNAGHLRVYGAVHEVDRRVGQPRLRQRCLGLIEVEDDERPDQARVYSNYLAFRSRLAGLKEDEEFFFGCRQDILRNVQGEWKLARRRIITDSVVLNAQNLSIFL